MSEVSMCTYILLTILIGLLFNYVVSFDEYIKVVKK